MPGMLSGYDKEALKPFIEVLFYIVFVLKSMCSFADFEGPKYVLNVVNQVTLLRIVKTQPSVTTVEVHTPLPAMTVQSIS